MGLYSIIGIWHNLFNPILLVVWDISNFSLLQVLFTKSFLVIWEKKNLRLLIPADHVSFRRKFLAEDVSTCSPFCDVSITI